MTALSDCPVRYRSFRASSTTDGLLANTQPSFLNTNRILSSNKKSKKNVSTITMVKIHICFLFLLLTSCHNVHKSETKTSSHPEDSLKEDVHNGRKVTEITPYGKTYQYGVDANNRLLYSGGYFPDLDRKDTIFYSYKNNKIVGFRYSSGIRPTEEDSLDIIRSLVFEEDRCDTLNRLGVKFFSPDINTEEIHDVSTVLIENKYSKKKAPDGSVIFTVSQPEPYGRKTFSAYIDWLINGDSYLTRYELITNDKGWIKKEIYTFCNVVVTRTYHYSKREMDIRIYQDDKMSEEYKYYMNFDLTLE